MFLMQRRRLRAGWWTCNYRATTLELFRLLEGTRYMRIIKMMMNDYTCPYFRFLACVPSGQIWLRSLKSSVFHILLLCWFFTSVLRPSCFGHMLFHSHVIPSFLLVWLSSAWLSSTQLSLTIWIALDIDSLSICKLVQVAPEAQPCDGHPSSICTSARANYSGLQRGRRGENNVDMWWVWLVWLVWLGGLPFVLLCSVRP